MSREGCHGPAAVAATSGSPSETGINKAALQHDPIYVFPKIKLRAASFPISTFMDLCAIFKFPRINECENWERGRAVSFLLEYLFRIFGTVSLQCGPCWCFFCKRETAIHYELPRNYELKLGNFLFLPSFHSCPIPSLPPFRHCPYSIPAPIPSLPRFHPCPNSIPTLILSLP